MFTGFYPSALTADWVRPLQGGQPTIAEIFKANGYMTAGFAANHFYTSWESGLTRGFVHYEDYQITAKQALLSTTYFQTNLWWSVRPDPSVRNIVQALAAFDLQTQPIWNNDRTTAERITAEFLEWERHRPDRPFFAFINLFDAHLPYEPPAPWLTRFGSSTTAKNTYDGAIAYMDHEVGRLLDSLEKRGALDNTIVVITSDHGEELGEHGLNGHGRSLYRFELHVPLVVRYPSRVPRGARVSKVVTLRDLGATLIDLARVNAAPAFPGVSLATTWSDSAARRSDAIAEVSAGIRTEPQDPVSRGPMRSLVDDEAHYIHNGDNVDELYDWHGDPVASAQPDDDWDSPISRNESGRRLQSHGPRLTPPDKERDRSAEKSADDQHDFKNKPGRNCLHCRNAERRKQCRLRRFSDTHAALRDWQEPGNLCERPHEHPDVQRNLDSDHNAKPVVQHHQQRLEQHPQQEGYTQSPALSRRRTQCLSHLHEDSADPERKALHGNQQKRSHTRSTD
jgi:arylsulfatase A-like enzyme